MTNEFHENQSDYLRIQSFSVFKAPKVGESEQGRQAINALRGYAYQVYQTVLAWLQLNSDELLFIKGAV
jgi:hypothetical protein